MANPGFAAACLEAVSVARRRLACPTVAVAVTDRPAVLDHHGYLLGDQVVAVVGIEPGAAAANDRARAAHLIVHAEAVGVLSVALTAVFVVVVVQIAIKNQVPAVALGDEQPWPEVVMNVQELENVVARALTPDRVVRVRTAGPHRAVGN